MTLTEDIQALIRGVRAGQFLSVGIMGALFDTLVLTLVVEFAGIEPFWAKFVSAEAAIILMFVVNDRWTFSGEAGGGLVPTGKRFVRSNVVRAGGVAVALSVLYVLNGQFGVWYALANVIGIGVGFVVNYVAESLFTWRVHME
ncbi:GtrA family protein [Salarchaeum sp. III]|uniref:GtrA family protein n=1 Tax=Salarchaeum sp. III TaxID=3107927 RepID=UPI002ED7AC02